MTGDPLQFYVAVHQPGTPFRLVVEAHGSTTAGREPANAVMLPHPLVSRRHARFTIVEGGQFLVEDLESRNGILANGVRILGSVVLAGPASLEIGPFTLALTTTVSDDTWTATAPSLFKPPRTMLDRGVRQFHVDGALVLDALSVHEYALLDSLATRSPNVVERSTVGDAVWGAGQWDVYMLHNLVSRIRKRVAQAGGAESVIVTVPGVGYRLE